MKTFNDGTGDGLYEFMTPTQKAAQTRRAHKNARNTLTVHPSPRYFFHPTFVSVQTVTEEGAPYTFARIFRNKHGRSNLDGVGNHKFYAGSRSHSAVLKYARTVDPNTTERYFIERGQLQSIT